MHTLKEFLKKEKLDGLVESALIIVAIVFWFETGEFETVDDDEVTSGVEKVDVNDDDVTDDVEIVDDDNVPDVYGNKWRWCGC